MALGFETIIWYLLLLDSVIYSLLAWFDGKWYKRNFRVFSRKFPLNRYFGALYFVLVLWVGSALVRLGLLP